MRSRHRRYIHCLFTVWIAILFLISGGCGAVGPPIPPEDVGIEAKLRQQQQEQAKKEGLAEKDQAITPVDEAVELPEMYPIGTR
jgi:hypothetical protein